MFEMVAHCTQDSYIGTDRDRQVPPEYECPVSDHCQRPHGSFTLLVLHLRFRCLRVVEHGDSLTA